MKKLKFFDRLFLHRYMTADVLTHKFYFMYKMPTFCGNPVSGKSLKIQEPISVFHIIIYILKDWKKVQGQDFYIYSDTTRKFIMINLKKNYFFTLWKGSH